VSEPGGWAARRATIKDVARRAGVSVATVSHAVSGRVRVSEALREKVREAIQELDYQPNALARHLRRRATGLIGMIVPDAGNPFYAAVAQGLEDAGLARGHLSIICNSKYEPRRELAYIDALCAHRVGGIALVPITGSFEPLERLRRRGVATVVLDHDLPGAWFDCLVVDNVRGADLATTHLLELGHRRIGFLDRPEQETRHVVSRRQGYEATLRRAGLTPDPALVASGGLDYQDAARAAERLLRREPRPTALVCFNDVMAIGSLAAARRLGLGVPRDLSIVGFDDVPLSGMVNPPLTSVAQPKARLGQLAAELLAAGMTDGERAEPRHVVLEPSLVVRDSTGPVPLR
jgi:LacI family transcriptional regulator, galactose operon repressor